MAVVALVATALSVGVAQADTPKPVSIGGTDPANDRISAVVGSDSRISEGAFPNSASAYKIIYGWPGTGTSYATIETDGQPLEFGSSAGSFTTAPHDSDAVTNTSQWAANGVATTQTVKLVTNPDTGLQDTVAVTYTSENTDTVAHSVGIRAMVDTDVNDNDGAPFRVPGVGPVTTETDLTGSAIPDSFQVFASLSDSQHIASARLRGGSATAPDRLVIGTWPGLVSNPWDYTITPGLAITNDSAFAAYWNPVSLGPGQSRSVTYYYGLSNLTVDLTPPLAVGLSGPASLATYGQSYTPNPFTVTATVADVGTASATGVSLSLNLPVGLHANSYLTLVPDLSPGGPEDQASWQITADSAPSDRTLTYSVTASAANAPSKTVSRSIFIPASNYCTGVAFLGLRGSGELATDNGGYGPEVDAIRSAFLAHLPAPVTSKAFPINYTADSTSDLTSLTQVLSGGAQRYVNSIEDGISKLNAAIQYEHKTCPSEKLVLAGYSQGALVVNEVVRAYANAPYITGVLLVADPARTPSQPGALVGTASPGFGIFQVVQHNLPSLPSSLGPVIAQLCEAHDIVCDWSHHGVNFAGDTAIHTAYATTDLLLLQWLGIHAVRSSGWTP